MNVLSCTAMVWAGRGSGGRAFFSLPVFLVKWTIWTFLRSSCGLEALRGMQEVLALQNTSLCFQ